MRKFAGCVIAAVLSATVAFAAPAGPHWVASWASAQMVPNGDSALGVDAYRNITLRQSVRLSLGGQQLRVHLSNAFGTAPLHIAAVHVARARASGASAIDPATDTALSFAGRGDVTIPAGAKYISDPVSLTVPAHGDLAITIVYDEPPSVETGHPGSRTTSYIVAGNHAGDADLTDAKKVDHWYQIAAVDVMAAKGTVAIATVGDSITDGRGSTTNGNDRWTDVLAGRLNKAAVLNFGIGGGRILQDGLGPNVLARFDRDILGQASVGAVLILEGVNDLGTLTIQAPVPPERHADLVHRIVAAYGQVIERAHAAGLKAYGATITPYGGSDYYHPTAENEADRQAINAWIRAPGHFDGVADFDAAIRDPHHPDRLKAEFDSGDHLHPSPAGYRAMGAAVPIEIAKVRR